MTTRRRRTTKPAATTPVEEPTHEEMLEIAEEREEEEQEEPVEVFLAASLADTFEAIQKAEEGSGTSDFFDTTPREVRAPAVVVPKAQQAKSRHNVSRTEIKRRKS